MADSTNRSGEALEEFLARKGVEGQCPMCRRNDWSRPRGASYAFVLLGGEPFLETRGGSPYYPVYFLYCNNCGFVSQYLKAVVDADALREGEAQQKEPQNER